MKEYMPLIKDKSDWNFLISDIFKSTISVDNSKWFAKREIQTNVPTSSDLVSRLERFIKLTKITAKVLLPPTNQITNRYSTIIVPELPAIIYLEFMTKERSYNKNSIVNLI